MNRAVRACAAAVVMVAGAACGGDGDGGEPEAQPVPGGSGFQEGDFDQLPHYPGSEPAGEVAVEEDVTSRSFEVDDATPARVVSWFADELEVDGWTVVEPPAQVGAEQTHRGVWRRHDRRLVVSATRFSGFDDRRAGRITQYSLSLGPA